MRCGGVHVCEDDSVQHTCDLGALELRIQRNTGQIAQHMKTQNENVICWTDSSPNVQVNRFILLKMTFKIF